MISPGTTHRPILCPECNYRKVMLYSNKVGEREEQPCHTCQGEGVVNMIITISYEIINH